MGMLSSGDRSQAHPQRCHSHIKCHSPLKCPLRPRCCHFWEDVESTTASQAEEAGRTAGWQGCKSSLGL